MPKVNVLIFPAGEINSVELHDALSHNVNINVFGCSSVDRHGEYVFRKYKSGLPNISDVNFIEKFNELIREWNIHYVFPTHDTVALFFAKMQKEIEAKIIVSPLETAEICRDKRKTYELFKEYSFCPKQFDAFEHLPVFIKPRDGQGAKGTKLIKTAADVPNNINISEYTINEYLPGEELTVDCMTDSNGRLCACLPRMRNRLLAGVSVAGETMKPTDEILYIASEINNELSLFGLWYFQVKQDSDGKYKLLEISTRCAGTMCLSRARGVNLPLLSVYAAQGKDITVFENPGTVTMDRTLISRYRIDYEYETVFIDYDDTVIEKDSVCIPVISFLHQCKNNRIETVLLTRHEAEHNDSIEESLEKHAISKLLFSRIIKLSVHEKKSDFICDKSIFIDNAYAERKEVHDKKGIPVYDVEGIEVLLDWRV